MSVSKIHARACEQDREDVRLRREQWLEDLPRLDPAHLVFIDKSGAKTNMTRQRGRFKSGIAYLGAE